jgi:hypothetical protein
MRIERVIVASDTNPAYLPFWPLVARAWKEIAGFEPVLAFIADRDTVVDETIAEVIRFEPIPGIPTGFQAQAIRLLLPIYFEDDVSLISDMDLIPLSKAYFVDSVAHCPEHNFVVFRDGVRDLGKSQYPMCYVAAQGKTFKEVFRMSDRTEIPSLIKEWYALGLGWTTDQQMLYSYLNRWDRFEPRCVRLGHDVTRRIDRANWRYDADLIKQNFYIDAHLPRPYDAHKQHIDRLASLYGLVRT